VIITALINAVSVLEMNKMAWCCYGVFHHEGMRVILSNPILDGTNVRYDLKKPFKLLSEMRGDLKWRTG
jgi:hypothetical protein